MYEKNLIRHEVAVKLDVDSGRELFVAHHEVRRTTILAVDLDDERPFAGVPTDPALPFAGL
jgi:hypothetical protein